MKENSPDLWRKEFPRRGGNRHKYDFGHAVIFAARSMTGATRLAAAASARIGAGLTTVVADDDVAAIYRSSLPAHIVVEDAAGDFQNHFKDERRNAVLVGPGGGSDYAVLRRLTAAVCQAHKKTVIDADALNALSEKPYQYAALHSACVLTPHEVEFARLFPELKGSREERAKEAAVQTKANIVLKGAETVIAAPDGRCALNKSATPNLATAGTGDVLAGMVTGLLAQGMEPFAAACAAVWVHGECARRIGPGLVASDIEPKIAEITWDLF